MKPNMLPSLDSTRDVVLQDRDMLPLILAFLPVNDIVKRTSLVNKHWHQCTLDDTIWSAKLRENFDERVDPTNLMDQSLLDYYKKRRQMRFAFVPTASAKFYDHGRIIRKVLDRWESVIGESRFSKGICAFEFILHKVSSTNLLFGICDEDLFHDKARRDTVYDNHSGRSLLMYTDNGQLWVENHEAKSTDEVEYAKSERRHVDSGVFKILLNFEEDWVKFFWNGDWVATKKHMKLSGKQWAPVVDWTDPTELVEIRHSRSSEVKEAPDYYQVPVPTLEGLPVQVGVECEPKSSSSSSSPSSDSSSSSSSSDES